jgi:hypothetical protein
MNAGAEYVLYRIWATLQEREGIHAESLLTCLGALAGYACQAYARRAGGRMGLSQLSSDSLALDRPLVISPMSVWALVRNAVQKIGGQLPDLEDITSHVTGTLGTSAFGVPRVPEAHRPRRLPIVYLTQLWPQVLPIAQRFCRRPSQLPVLFGIALQRAIEYSKLEPALAARLAMESAVAMSKATLPNAIAELFQAPRAAPDITVTAKPAIAPAFPEIRATRKRRTPIIDTFDTTSLTARMRSAKGLATIMSVAIIAVVAGLNWKSNRPAAAPMTARVASGLKAPVFQTRPNTYTNTNPAPSFEEAPPVVAVAAAATQAPPQQQQSFPEELPQPAEELALPAPAVPDTSEGIITEDGQSA